MTTQSSSFFQGMSWGSFALLYGCCSIQYVNAQDSATLPTQVSEPNNIAIPKSNSTTQLSKQIERIAVSTKLPVKPINDIPKSITVLNEDDLATLQINSLDDLVFAMPNVGVRGNSAINSGFHIRGVGSDNWHVNANQGIAVAFDETNIASPYVSQLAAYDLASVEVFRGPQSALFGINSSGGAVNFNTQQPQLDEYSGFAELTFGTFNRKVLTGALNLPINETIASRIAFQRELRDGPWTNLYNNEPMGDIDINSWRWQTKWEIHPDHTVVYSHEKGRNHSGKTPLLGGGYWDINSPNIVSGQITDLNAAPDCEAALTQNIAVFISPTCVSIIPFTGGQTQTVSTGSWATLYDASEDIADTTFTMQRLRYSWVGDVVSLKSITSYDNLSAQYLESLSNLPQGIGFMPGQISQIKQWAQELTLTWEVTSDVTTMLGTYFANKNSKLSTIISRTDNDGAPFGIVPSVVIEQVDKTRSWYGWMEYDPESPWLFNLALRYTQQRQKGVSTTRVFAKTIDATPAAQTLPFGSFITENQFATLSATPAGVCPPSVGGIPCMLATPVSLNAYLTAYNADIAYFIKNNLNMYISTSRGFVGGSFDTRALAAFAGTADQPVAPEQLTAFEWGIKYQSAALKLHSALFHYTWQDKQIFDVNNLGQPAFVNIPEAQLQGLELSGEWQFTSAWTVDIGLGWLDSEVTDVGTLQGVKTGNALTNIAPFNHTFGLHYEREVFGTTLLAGTSRLSLLTQFVGPQYSSKDNDQAYRLAKYKNINVHWQHTLANLPQWVFSLGVKNLTAEKYCLKKNQNTTLSYNLQCLPNIGERQWYVEMRYRYEN